VLRVLPELLVLYFSTWYGFQDFKIQKNNNSTFKYGICMSISYGHILEIQEGVKTAPKTEPRCKVFDFIIRAQYI